MTPKQIHNISDEIDGDTKLLDGLEDLSPEDQEKIVVALAEGHVADEDWKEVRGNVRCYSPLCSLIDVFIAGTREKPPRSSRQKAHRQSRCELPPDTLSFSTFH